MVSRTADLQYLLVLLPWKSHQQSLINPWRLGCKEASHIHKCFKTFRALMDQKASCHNMTIMDLICQHNNVTRQHCIAFLLIAVLNSLPSEAIVPMGIMVRVFGHNNGRQSVWWSGTEKLVAPFTEANSVTSQTVRCQTSWLCLTDSSQWTHSQLNVKRACQTWEQG